ncbi:hypothetical protein JHK82_016597 [Glycine max]|nr:hypothetical protein JHK85_017012 [Glycine max]KAG5149716.1 hypothetical protein JHK82_016597 [Glycine max]
MDANCFRLNKSSALCSTHWNTIKRLGNNKSGFESLVEAATVAKQKFDPIQQQEVIIQALHKALPKPILSLVSSLLIISHGIVTSKLVHRGNLTLVLLPSSDLRLSFIGDDGRTERLFTLTNKSQCSGVMVDEIPTDSSGRSFLVRTPDSRICYFWCSEKSKLLGIELLGKVILAILLD